MFPQHNKRFIPQKYHLTIYVEVNKKFLFVSMVCAIVGLVSTGKRNNRRAYSDMDGAQLERGGFSNVTTAGIVRRVR